MTVRESRREFMSGLCAAGVTALAGPWLGTRAAADDRQAQRIKSPFRVAVINDEISQDFGRACEVASREFGMEWIELRGMWNKNILNLDPKEIAEAQRILKAYQLRVTDIASPLFKVDWAGAPRSKYSEGDSFKASFTFAQQDEVLERAIALAKTFQTDRVRCFDFWRLGDPVPYRAAMNEKLLKAANRAGKEGDHSGVGERTFLQYSDCGGSRQGAKRREVTLSHAELGPRECRSQRRDTLSRRLQSPAERSNRPLPLQRRGQARHEVRLGTDGWRVHRLGRTVQGPRTRRLSSSGQPRNSLERRRNGGEIVAPELGGDERLVASGGRAVGAYVGAAK